jgi:glucokinase
MQVLAGDIGGTKVLLQIAELDRDSYRVVHERRFFSNVYPAFEPIVREFMQTCPPGLTIDAACFGLAGPITVTGKTQLASLTNLPWQIDSTALAMELKTSKVRLINDFQAAGYGVEALRPEDLVTLQSGQAHPRAPRNIIGAGTGLGQGILFWEQDYYEVLATEGGHVDFAPTDELQVALWRYLKKHFDRVSYERVVSGPGLVHIYTFLRETGVAPESPEVVAAMDSADPAAAISQAGLAGYDELAKRTLDLFVTIYGAQAGNFALTTLPTGGVYIAGGIAPKIIDKLTDGTFMRAFLDKGRMADLVAKMPVHVVMNTKVGLIGAALAAGRL